MGYIYAVLSVFAGAVKGFCGKKTSGYTAGIKDAMLFNCVRMFFCVIIGFVLSVLSGGFSTLKISSTDILSIILSGVFSAVFVVTWLITVKNGAYVMLDVFLMLGVIVPILGSNIFFGEEILLKQWIGLGILIVATLILCSYSNKIKTKIKPSYFLILLVCGLSCGLSDFSQKIFILNKTETLISTFNLYSYLISFVILGVCFLVFPKSEEQNLKKNLPVLFIYLLIMAVCLFLNSYFQTLAASSLLSAQLFPLAKSLALILSVTMAAVFFKEKVNLKCILGVLTAFAGILIINL